MRRLRPAASDTKACPERGRAFFVGQGGTFFIGRGGAFSPGRAVPAGQGGAFSPGRDEPFPSDGDGLQPEQKKESAGEPLTDWRFGEDSEKNRRKSRRPLS